MSGRLVLCPTPLGNLEDVTLRVLRCLRECDAVFAEDTRVSEALLRHFEIRKPMRSFHERVEASRLRELHGLLAAGKTVAFVTDAGMPGISDPGVELVRTARDAGATVEVLPGPSALLGALVLSGFDVARFRFDGFPPRKSAQRLTYLESLRAETVPIVWYEAPTRVRGLLEGIRSAFGDRRVFALREYTKKFEEHLSGSASEVLTQLDDPPRGEFVVVLDGAANLAGDSREAPERVAEAMSLLLNNGVRARLAVDALRTATGVRRNVLYDLAHGQNSEDE